MADSTHIEAVADRHPDSVAEAIRWTICEGELLQIIGRARAVNRGPDDPVDVVIFCDVALPLRVNVALTAADVEPSPTDRMLAAGGVALQNPTAAAAAYPALWRTREAAKSALSRARLGANWNKKSTFQNAPNLSLRRVQYQLTGAGQKPAVAWCDLELVPDPVAWLTQRLGPLAWCRTGDRPGGGIVSE